jgi:nitroreductase
MPLEQCTPIQESLFPKSEHLEHFFKARRSIRSFKDEKVKREELEKTIEMARYAPTGGNSQLVKWIIVYEREDVLKIGGMVADFFRSQIAKDPTSEAAIGMQNIVTTWESGFDFICRGAPHLVLAYAPDLRGATDCIIALSYQELAAFSLGLGPCWGGYVMATGRNNWPDMRKFLNIPAEHTVFGAMLIGYPNYKYQRLPLRNEADVSWIG